MIDRLTEKKSEHDKEIIFMSGQRKFLQMWARTVGMPIGNTDDDKPTFLPISLIEVKRAFAMRTFWIALHVLGIIFF